MPKFRPVSPDPLTPIAEESSPGMDLPAHVRTFNAVMGLAKWFVAHLALILVALYFFAIAGNSLAGTFFLLCAVALFIFGVLRRATVRRDISDAMDSGPGDKYPRIEGTR
jgi:hypothetical protein